MKPHIFELKLIHQGSLCIMPCPRSDSLAEDLSHFMQMGIHKVVSLLEPEEARSLGVEHEEPLCRDLNIEFQNFPIPDRKTPANPRQFHKLVEQLYAELQSGKHVSIHCFAGIGRTGVLAGSLLIRDGMEPRDAIELMSRVRGFNMPQTQEQYEFLTGEKPEPSFRIDTSNSSSWSWFRRLLSPTV